MDEMTRKERVIAALDHEPVDRVPTDYWGVPEITAKLMSHLGAKDDIDFADRLGIDKVMVVDPPLASGRQNMWDITYKKVPLAGGYGYYDEPVFFPIGDCKTIDEIEEAYEWPRPDMYDYSAVGEQCERYRDFAIEGGYTSLTYHYTMIRGIEQMMVDFIDNPELARYILMKIQEFCYEHSRRILEAGDGRIDYTQMTDDLGSQTGLLMGPAMVDEYLKDYYDQTISMIHSYGSRAFHHDDGAMTAIMPWLMERDIDILNPLQWHLPGWDLKEMKALYGGRLCFHGGIDNQRVLPFGTVEEVRGEVKACLDALFNDRTGYILAPCHNIQAITPVENVIAMYEAAREYS